MPGGTKAFTVTPLPGPRFGLILTVGLCRMSIYTCMYVGAIRSCACAKRGLTELPAKVLLVDRAHSSRLRERFKDSLLTVHVLYETLIQ